MKLSLIVPCYNEEENVKNFFDETNEVFQKEISNYEFVFIDDGSEDETLSNLKKIYKKANNNFSVQILSFSRNFGKEAAIYAGLQKATGEVVCLIDADLQQRPEVVVKMLRLLQSDEKIDCVTAYQDKRIEKNDLFL